MLKTYQSKVLDILPDGDAILELPPEMCEELGWKDGDTLSITQEEKEGNIIIKKIKDGDSNNSLDNDV
jgi:bifunctional DNA-binding transcriptional regulator/antitoxin component of YhaV-PrlF toxin-antitoxin module